MHDHECVELIDTLSYFYSKNWTRRLKSFPSKIYLHLKTSPDGTKTHTVGCRRFYKLMGGPETLLRAHIRHTTIAWGNGKCECRRGMRVYGVGAASCCRCPGTCDLLRKSPAPHHPAANEVLSTARNSTPPSRWWCEFCAGRRRRHSGAPHSNVEVSSIYTHVLYIWNVGECSMIESYYVHKPHERVVYRYGTTLVYSQY